MSARDGIAELAAPIIFGIELAALPKPPRTTGALWMSARVYELADAIAQRYVLRPNESPRAENAEERGEGICRTCLEPIWNEGGTVGHVKRTEGWSDRIERGGDSLVCFKSRDYRHVPLTGREAAIYDRAYERALSGDPS